VTSSIEPAAPDARPAPAGSLSVLVMPWADIEWIENLDTGQRQPSDRSAPARLDLPPGRYRLRLVNPYSDRPLDLDAVVNSGQDTAVRRTMPGFDASEMAREILRQESGTPGG